MSELTHPHANDTSEVINGEVFAAAISIELRRVARRARVPKPISSGGGGFRARRSEKIFKALLVGSCVFIFIIPSFIMGVYLYFFAADQYVAESRFVVSSSQQSSLEGMASISSILSGTKGQDGLIVADYVSSGAMLDALNSKFDVRKMFSPGTRDFIAELPTDSSREKVLKFWESHVSVSVNRTSGLVTMKIRTFSPNDSLVLSNAILELSEGMVNKLTHRNEVDAFGRAEDEMHLSREKLERATASLRDARNSAGVLDVTITAKAYADVVSQLRLNLSKIEQDIAAMTKVGSATAPQVIALRNRASALKDQIQQYENSIAGGAINIKDPNQNLAQRALELNQKELELKIAQEEYASAVAEFEKVRLTSQQQQAYLVPYITPNLVEESNYPKRGLVLSITVAISLLIWSAFAGLATLVRDHMA
ncbi:hypothetical protein [Agrobacterium vitis]|uniref:Capsule biosynthesis protein n=1 Tax=Agrobacterium vitis TaxID=373 RepID=A0A7K1RN55_AGRVI|nr:hypothetical protein [Agrobacterium vitis]MVA59454.1 hypothetical protein [Agrobacterium vitis]